MRGKHIITFFFILFFAGPAFAQNREADSIYTLIKNARHDTSRAWLWVALSDALYYSNPDTLKPLSEKAIIIVEENLRKKTTKRVRESFLSTKSAALNNIGIYYQLHGEIKRSIDCYKKALEIQTAINDRDGMAGAYYNLGYIYKNEGDIRTALEYYHKALKLDEEAGDKKDIAYSLNNIGVIYKNLGDTARAMGYWKRSLKLRLEIKDKPGIATGYNNIGSVYKMHGDYKTAMAYYKKCLAIQAELGDRLGNATTLSNVASIYENTKRYDSAMFYYQASLAQYKQVNEKQGITLASIAIAKLLHRKGKSAEALALAKKAHQIALEIGYPEPISNSAGFLSTLYLENRNYKEALEMQTLYYKMRDSLTDETARKSAVQKQFEYEYQKKVAADSARALEKNKVSEAKIQAQDAELKQAETQRYALFGGLALLVIIAVIIFRSLKQSRKANTTIAQQKQVVEMKQKEIIDSIHYAKRIQQALMPSQKSIEKKLNNLKKS
ncbi:MAG TPA: tetratricopeptide repeat protein [Flavobacteriales bacterium]|nr:tetratricopeptide repeat protein [Flavobacteriales bacterium]